MGSRRASYGRAGARPPRLRPCGGLVEPRRGPTERTGAAHRAVHWRAALPSPKRLMVPGPAAESPPDLGGALRRLRAGAAPPRSGALLRLFPRLKQERRQRAQLKVLVRHAQQLTPGIAGEVARLAWSNPDAALTTFVREFQRRHFELDETMCEQGFDLWADAAAECIPILVRGADRCNGIEPLGYRTGFALM